MNAPIIWIVIPTFAAIIFLLIQRKRRRYILFVSFSLFLVFTTYIVKIDPENQVAFYEISLPASLRVLGRSFDITQNDIFLVRVIYLLNALWGIVGYFFDQHDRVIPLGMLYSAMLLAAYSVTPFLYAALIIALAAILSIPLLVDNKIQKTDGVGRYLLFQILALPFILLAGWFLAGGEITPVDPSQLEQATLLLGLGFILWLGVFPFHSWIPLLYRDLKSINLGFLLLMLVFIIFLILLKFIDGFTWLRQYGIFFQTSLVLGAIMQGLGALGIFFQENLEDLNGYALLHVIGWLLTSLGISSFSEATIIPHVLSVLIICLSIMHITTPYLENEEDRATIGSLKSNNHFLPALIGYIYGLFTLAGLPLTIAFGPSQWIHQVLAKTTPIYFWVSFLGKILIAMVSIRLLKVVFDKNFSANDIKPNSKKEWFLVVLLGIVIVLGLFPNIVLSGFEQLVSGFENLIQ